MDPIDKIVQMINQLLPNSKYALVTEDEGGQRGVFSNVTGEELEDMLEDALEHTEDGEESDPVGQH